MSGLRFPARGSSASVFRASRTYALCEAKGDERGVVLGLQRTEASLGEGKRRADVRLDNRQDRRSGRPRQLRSYPKLGLDAVHQLVDRRLDGFTARERLPAFLEAVAQIVVPVVGQGGIFEAKLLTGAGEGIAF